MIHINNFVHEVRKYLIAETSKDALDALDNLDAIEEQFKILLHDMANATQAARSSLEIISILKEENYKLTEELKQKDAIIASYPQV